MGERHAGSVEVRGSSPLISTKKDLLTEGLFLLAVFDDVNHMRIWNIDICVVKRYFDFFS